MILKKFAWGGKKLLLKWICVFIVCILCFSQEKLFANMLVPDGHGGTVIVSNGGSAETPENGGGSGGGSDNSGSDDSDNSGGGSSDSASNDNGGQGGNSGQTGGSGNSGQGGSSGGSSQPSTPSTPSYPDPTDSMTDSQLQEIAQGGTSEQKEAATEILAAHEHTRVNNQLLGENASLDGQVEAVMDTVVDIPKAVEETPLPEGKKEEVKKVSKKRKDETEYFAAEPRKNTKESKKTQVKANSAEDGDPVLITEGAYIQKERDFEFTGPAAFSIRRTYHSANQIVSSFGFGWFTNLDERIILGTAASPEEHKKALQEYSQSINQIIRDYEKELSEAYGLDIYRAIDEFSERIDDLKKEQNKARTLLDKEFSLLQRAAGYEAAVDIERVKNKTNVFIVSIGKEIEKYEAAIEDIGLHLERLAKYKDEYDKSLYDLREYEKDYQLAMYRKNRNKAVMFPGMPLWYEETGFDCLTFIDERGYPHLFYETEENSGVWHSEGENVLLEIRGHGDSLELIQTDGVRKLFDAKGFLVQIRDRNNNEIRIIRGSDEKIDYIETSDEEKLKFEYQNTFISKITNVRSADMNVVYRYKGNLLESVKDFDGDSVTMSYDDNNRLYLLNKCDKSFVKFDYGEMDSMGNVLTTSTTNEEGASEYFIYDRAAGKTEYINHDGNKNCYWYDERHRTVRELHSDGTDIIYRYDEADNVVYKNENGNITEYTYDSAGNMISASYSDGSHEYWEYDEYNLLISHIDRDGVSERYIRDSKGNLKEYKLGGQSQFTQEFNERGQVTKRVQYGQKQIISEYAYDSHGNLMTESCGGIVKEYEYDTENRIKKEFQAGEELSSYNYDKGKIERLDRNGLLTRWITNGRKDVTGIIKKDTVTGQVHELSIEYDKRHLPMRVYCGSDQDRKILVSYLYTAEGIIRALIMHGDESWIKIYEYQNGEVYEIKQLKLNRRIEMEDVNEKMLAAWCKACGENNISVQQYKLSKLGMNKKQLAVTDSLGLVNLYDYDSYGNLVKETDGIGQVRQMIYSRAGRLKQIQGDKGGWYDYSYNDSGYQSGIGEVNQKKIQTEYYADGSLKKITDRYGMDSLYYYDEAGRIRSVQSAAKKIWFEYDNFDRVTQAVIGNSGSINDAVYYTIYNYSSDGRRLVSTDGGKYATVYELDAFGNIIKERDGNNNERSYVYNSLNQLVEALDGYQNKTRFEYNALGLLSKETDPDGEITEYSYNHLGQLVQITDPAGVLYSASYDKAGRLIKEKNRADCEKEYEYDSAGRLIKAFCGGDLVEEYSYGSYGRTLTVKDGMKNEYQYYYDSFGRLTRERNRNQLEQSYIYDEEGKLKSKAGFSNGSCTISFSPDRRIKTYTYNDGSYDKMVYDSAGNIVEASNESGLFHYEYDKGGRLVYQNDIRGGEEVCFEYDAAGNRTRLLSNNSDLSYVYGSNNELKEIFDNKQRLSVKLSYNKKGQEILREFGNGTKEETLYDSAGRVIVKMQKNARGELLWGEGYVYGSDGKRSASVDNQCRITFYEYDNHGRLSSVLYPYTKELSEQIKAEAELNGLPVKNDSGENYFLSSRETAAIIPLLNAMSYGLAFDLPGLQTFIKESYLYDNNGNRTAKLNSYGKIEYTYDSENCLVSSGSRGEAYVNYSYDSDGNLLTERSASKVVKYAYNTQNRLIYCEVTDKDNKTYAESKYSYDPFGRRLTVQDKDEAALRTLYDGFTFDIIKQSPVYANGMFTDGAETGIRWGNSGRPTGDRYRYLSDEDRTDENRYFYLDENTYRTVSTRYHGSRTPITINGIIAGQSTNENGVEYFTSDMLGSIRTTTDSYGTTKTSCTYSAFGSLIQGDLTGTTDFGYLGKQLDSTATLYNYGYRDYNPASARFTTIDPIRDSTNWFSYCNGDPVNFVDLWGLCASDRMTSLKKQKELEEKFGYNNVLCYITSGLNAYISDGVVTETFIETKLENIIKDNLTADNTIKDFNVYSKELAKGIGVDYYYSYVYDKNNDWNQVSYAQKDKFDNSKYTYGIGRYLKPNASWCDKNGADHFELLRNKPYSDIINPGIADDEGNYILHDVLPLQKLSL